MFMRSFDLQLDLANLIKAYSFHEIELENLKISSFECPHFNIYEAYSLINGGMKPSPIDNIVRFLKFNHIIVSKNEIQMIFKFFLDKEVSMFDFQDFVYLLSPKTNPIIVNETLKQKKHQEKYFPFNYYELITEISDRKTASIMEKELSYIHEIQLLQTVFNSNNPKVSIDEIYEIIKTQGNEKIINYECLQKFLNKLKVSYTKEEYYALMRAIKAENINKITRMDLLKIFFIDQMEEKPINETFTHPLQTKKINMINMLRGNPIKKEKRQESQNRFFRKKIIEYSYNSQPKLLNLDKMFVQIQKTKENLKKLNLKLESKWSNDDDAFNINTRFYT